MRSCDHATLRTRVLALVLASLALSLASCASSLDMSHERTAVPGPEWGIVIGSVLVRQEPTGAGPGTTAGDRSTIYEFDVVQIQPADPNGESPYASRYHLEAVAGQERPFLARLRPGQYLMKNFHRSGISGTGETSVSSSRANRVTWPMWAGCWSKFHNKWPPARNIASPCRTPMRPPSHNSPRNMAA